MSSLAAAGSVMVLSDQPASALGLLALIGASIAVASAVVDEVLEAAPVEVIAAVVADAKAHFEEHTPETSKHLERGAFSDAALFYVLLSYEGDRVRCSRYVINRVAETMVPAPIHTGYPGRSLKMSQSAIAAKGKRK